MSNKIAVVGAGIAGLGCLWALHRSLTGTRTSFTLYEKNAWLGGHAHTVDVTIDGVTHGVDTGFLVYNHRTYPNLIRLFEDLGVATSASDMSFSVSAPANPCDARSRLIEWAGTDLDAVFAQRRNLASPRFLRMLREILRFNREATAIAVADSPEQAAASLTLGEFLDRHRYSTELRDWYLLPMAGAIWSCPTEQMLAFPMHTFARFCHNHALLQVSDRPQWRTVTGGARHYVESIVEQVQPTLRPAAVRIERAADAVRITAADGSVESFD